MILVWIGKRVSLFLKRNLFVGREWKDRYVLFKVTSLQVRRLAAVSKTRVFHVVKIGLRDKKILRVLKRHGRRDTRRHAHKHVVLCP